MYPIEGAIDVRQPVCNIAIFGEDSVANAFDGAVEFSVWMSHQIDIHMRPNVDVLQLGFAIVGDNIPGAGIDQRKHRSAGVRVGALRDVQIGYVGVEWGDDVAAFKIEPRAVYLSGLGGPLQFQRSPR